MNSTFLFINDFSKRHMCIKCVPILGKTTMPLGPGGTLCDKDGSANFASVFGVQREAGIKSVGKWRVER